MADPTQPETRRSRRERLQSERPQHRQSASVYLRRRLVAAGIAAAVVSGLVVGVIALATPRGEAVTDAAGTRVTAPDAPPRATAIPAPAQSGRSVPPAAAGADAGAAQDLCGDTTVQQALAAGADADVIEAAGGAEAFRVAVATGAAPCIDLFDPVRTWVVVNKTHALTPLDFAPEGTVWAEGVQRTGTERMRPDVAAALSQLVAAARADGAGEIGVNSAFRSYDYQVSNHAGFVRQLGRADAEAISARAGHSEHQTGLAVDVVACASSCGSIDDFAGTTQAQWVADNAWRFGFIVRYDQGETGATGYEWEPWHLRFVGADLAAAYTDGGYRTLEQFFGMPAAPHYAD